LKIEINFCFYIIINKQQSIINRRLSANIYIYIYTNDFLRKIKSVNLPSNAILATIDVVGLYPNIPHDEG